MDKKLERFTKGEGTLSSTDAGSETETTPHHSKAQAAVDNNANFVTPSTTKSNPSNQSVYAKICDVASKLSNQMADFEVKTLSQFDNLTSRLNALECVVRSIQENRSTAANGNDDVERILIKTPAWDTMPEYELILQKMENKTFRNQLEAELKSIGGDTAQNCTSNIMKKCFNKGMLKMFTLKGKGKDKGNFSASIFYTSVIGKFDQSFKAINHI